MRCEVKGCNGIVFCVRIVDYVTGKVGHVPKCYMCGRYFTAYTVEEAPRENKKKIEDVEEFFKNEYGL